MGATINNESTTTKPTAAVVTGGLNAIYWHQIYSLDSALIKTRQEGPEDHKATHLRLTGPFIDHNKQLHTNTQSSRYKTSKQLFYVSLIKPV